MPMTTHSLATGRRLGRIQGQLDDIRLQLIAMRAAEEQSTEGIDYPPDVSEMDRMGINTFRGSLKHDLAAAEATLIALEEHIEGATLNANYLNRR